MVDCTGILILAGNRVRGKGVALLNGVVERRWKDRGEGRWSSHYKAESSSFQL
jgi:hypothetical protein